jgi:transketolase
VTGLGKFKTERTEMRRLFTGSINQVKEKLHACPRDKVEVESLFRVAQDKANRLFKLDEEIRESWICKYESGDKAYQKDYEEAETYRDEYIIIKTRYENMFQRVHMDQTGESSSITTQSVETFVSRNWNSRNLIVVALQQIIRRTRCLQERQFFWMHCQIR